MIMSLKNVASARRRQDLSKRFARCLIKNMDDFAIQAYATFPGERMRTTVEVARLPKDALVEIDAIAHR